MLTGRIWAGHNILKFDCPRIREAFAGINRPPPEPTGTIDSLDLLTQRFGRRAGDMKVVSLSKLKMVHIYGEFSTVIIQNFVRICRNGNYRNEL